MSKQRSLPDASTLKFGYKVVSKRHSRYESCWSEYAEPYAIGITTKRSDGNGPLAVFTNLVDARNFVSHLHIRFPSGGPYFLFECQYTQSRDTWVWYEDGSGNEISPDGEGELPPSTALADSVELLREVTESLAEGGSK